MTALQAHCYAFGRFHLDPLMGRLTNGGSSIELRPKSIAVLHYLLAHPQRLVSKDELLGAVWGKIVVTEDSLVQCVREIRRALGDAEQHLIRTIPRGGYMFVGDVMPHTRVPVVEPAAAGVPEPAQPAPARGPWRERLAAPHGQRTAAGALVLLVVAALATLIPLREGREAGQPSGAGVTLSAAAVPPLSIAVLPLTNIGADPDQEYFAQGLTSDLTTDLGRVPASFVVSDNSARAYRGLQVDGRQAGRELGVRYLIEGSVQRMRDDVRVNLRLIDAATGAQRWAERFEGPRSELPQLQASIVRSIAQTLQVRLLESEAERSLRERSRSPNAQDLLMRGWALWERRRAADNSAARELFLQALETDPQFSLAWVGVAQTHLADLHQGWSADRSASLGQARLAVARAHELGPRHRDVNAVRGYVLFFQGDIESALAAFDREIEANPGHALAQVWRGLMLVSLGRPAEAQQAVEHGIALSPRDVDLHVFYRSMAHAAFSLGRFEDAAAWGRRAVGQTPTYVKGYGFLAAASALAGDSAAAASALAPFQAKYGSIAAFKSSLMPGEMRMFDATPLFWEALQKAGLPPT